MPEEPHEIQRPGIHVLARELGVKPSTVRKWVREDGLVSHVGIQDQRKLEFLWREVCAFFEARGAATAGRGGKIEGIDPDPEKTATAEEDRLWLARQRQEQARRLKRINDLEEALLLQADQVQEHMGFIASRFRMRAEALEAAFGVEVGDQVREMVAQVRADLEQFCASHKDRFPAPACEAGGDPEPVPVIAKRAARKARSEKTKIVSGVRGDRSRAPKRPPKRS